MQLDLGKQFRADKLADIFDILRVVGGLQTDKIELGHAQEGVTVEIGRNARIFHRPGRHRERCRRQIVRTGGRGGPCRPGVLHGLCLLRRLVTTEQQAEDEHRGKGQENHGHHIGQTSPQAEVREERGNAQSGRQTGDRAKPATCRRSRGRCACRCGTGWCGRRLLRRGGGSWRYRLALHADRTATAQTGGFGIANAQVEGKQTNKGRQKKFFHRGVS